MEMKPKRSYQKPTVERIELLTDQQLTASCKSDTGGGKDQTFPNPCRAGSPGPFSNACKFTKGS